MNNCCDEFVQNNKILPEMNQCHPKSLLFELYPPPIMNLNENHYHMEVN